MEFTTDYDKYTDTMINQNETTLRAFRAERSGYINDIYTISKDYGKQTAELYLNAEKAKNMVKFLKETDPVRYNLKISEINETALEEANLIEARIRQDVNDRLNIARERYNAISGAIQTNNSIISSQVEADIQTGAIFNYDTARLNSIAQLMGTTPTAIKQRAIYAIDSAINAAITASGKIFPNISEILAKAHSYVAQGMTTAEAVSRVQQEYGIFPRNELSI